MPSRVTVAGNLLKTWLLVAVPATAFGALGWRIAGYHLALLFAGSVVLLAVALYWYADRIVMGMLDARELLPGEAPALHAAIESLSGRAGVIRPRLYLLPGGYPRSAGAGRGPLGGGAIAVSTGLLALATPAELEGLVAHELGHMRHRDTLIQSAVVVLTLSIVELSRIGGAFQRGLLFLLGPIAASFAHLLLSPAREYRADRFAAVLCDSPHGLADALTRLEQAMEFVPFEGSPATEPVYVANPFAEVGLAALFVTHPPIASRVARLRDLDPDWRERLRAG